MGSTMENELTPWDIGKPTPVLISELKRVRELHQRQQELKHMDVRIKLEKDGGKDEEPEIVNNKYISLIPGCGGGYDLLTVAKHHELLRSILVGCSNNGCDINGSSIVIGLDISPTSLMKARDRVQHLIDEEIECSDIPSDPCTISNRNNRSKDDNDNINTTINFMHGDFFAPESTWSNISNIQYSRTGLDGNKEQILTDFKTIEGKDDDDNKSIRKSSNVKEPLKSFETIQKFDFIFDYTFFVLLNHH